MPHYLNDISYLIFNHRKQNMKKITIENKASILPETYLKLKTFRGDDVYPPEMDWEKIVTDFFPPTFEELVQRLSDISAAMYGIMLKQSCILFGADQINALSEAVFYNLGQVNSARIMSARPDFEKNLDGIFKIFIGTVFTANPEYKLEVLELNAHQGRMIIRGVDRYHKIAKALDLVLHLQWPVILPYIKAVSEGMEIDCSTEMKLISLNEKSECVYEVTIINRSEAAISEATL